MRGPLLLLCSWLVAASSQNIATTPVSRLQTPWWKQRFDEKQQELRTHPPELVWLGDSITQDWERDGPQPWLQFRPVWERFYGSEKAVNLGFKGDSTCHLLWRLMHGELDGYQPKLAIVLIGANNFGHIHTDAEATLEGIRSIVSVLHRKTPRTRIILVSVLPSIRSVWVSENTKRLNASLASAFVADMTVTFVDASSLFISQGHVDAAAFIDPKLTPPEPALHPTAQAQERLAALLQPIVTRDLAMPPP
jgi:lysophospholipase L1-like esterase